MWGKIRRHQNRHANETECKMRKHLFLTLIVVMLLRSLMEIMSIYTLNIAERGWDEYCSKFNVEFFFRFMAWYCFTRAAMIGWVWFIAMWIIVKTTTERHSPKKLLWICLGDFVFNFGAFCLLFLMISGRFTSELHIAVLVNQFLFSIVFIALFLLSSRKPDDSEEYSSEQNLD